MKWQCAKGHVWEATLSNVHNNKSWCPHCARKSPRTIGDANKLAQERGGKCLSKSMKNIDDKLEWKCERGHIWSVSFKKVYNGTWCRYCYYFSMRVNISDAQQLAFSNQGRCMSRSVQDSRDILEWMCSEGHIWNTSFNIIQRGHWCPHCAGNIRKSIQDMQNIAQTLGGECLSHEYVSRYDNLSWKCSFGHSFEESSHNILQGSWCPSCRRRNIEKQFLDEATCLAQKQKGNCVSKAWISSKEPLVWLCCNGHAFQATLQNVRNGYWCGTCRRNDTEKHHLDQATSLARTNNGVCLSDICSSVTQKLVWVCSNNHQFEASLQKIHKGYWCPICPLQERMNEARLAAKKCGGEIVTSTCSSIQKPLIWSCSNGHEFRASIFKIRTGYWCPTCRRQEYQKEKFTDAKSFASQRGGFCLSKEYISSTKHLLWQCSKGHQWRSSYSNIRSGSWCPVCRRRKNQLECAEIFSALYPEYDFRQEVTSDMWKEMRVDGFCEDIKLVWEYHGAQHYRFVKFFHKTVDRFERQQHRDQRLRDACEKNGCHIVEIPFWIKDKHIFIVAALCRLKLFRLLHS